MAVNSLETAPTAEERRPQWLIATGIQARVVMRLVLELVTPAHFGVGDVEGLLDAPILRDARTGESFIAGATLAGALRAYLARKNFPAAKDLFGKQEGSGQASYESWVRVGDARANGGGAQTELRDGVGINSVTRTAAAKLKYDFELLQAGTQFVLTIELMVPKGKPEYEGYLNDAVDGLNGAIRLGKRKRRGFGECRIASGQVWKYEFPADMLRWLDKPLSEDAGEWKEYVPAKAPPVSSEDCVVELTCTLRSGLLVRAAASDPNGQARNLPDHEPIRSMRRDDNGVLISRCILPGTSLAGVLRARTERIGNTLQPGKGKEWAERLFGKARGEGHRDTFRASSLWVDEAVIESPNECGHTRVKIDRFTGGAYPGALFSEGVLFPSEKTELTLKLRLEKPDNAKVGMLLLLVKDLWTGDLPVGGESGVGRGRLRGKRAEIRWNGHTWTLKAAGKDGEGLEITASDGAEDLNELVKMITGGKQ